uniref:Homeobox-leucine zipper protein HOX3-like n=1 Tax=Elaeis guineensis var. tenera TaxID=51953 RepID=A0A8N4F4I8_ELAGV|nr:homeobox-leucine zipper protein HOX3-like [Elaeis guineensis]
MEESGKSPSVVEHVIPIPGASSSAEPEKRGSNIVRDFDINHPAPEKGEDEDIPEGGAADNAEEGENENPRRKRLRLSKEQTKLLEQSFRVNQNISRGDKEELAVKAKVKPRQVEVWFQNRRVRYVESIKRVIPGRIS